MTSMSETLVLPGQALGPSNKFSPGAGTHIQKGQIHASILGRIVKSSSSATKKSPPILSVERPSPPNVRSKPLLPAVGAQVYARITRIQRQQAICEIVVLSDLPSAAAAIAAATPATPGTPTPPTKVAPAQQSSPTPTPFRGIIRAQDVRATEKDKVVMGASFRVGDIVRAIVISLGDQGGYFLSTAGNAFGVVMSWSESGPFGVGNACVPVSWKEVQDVVTGAREERKVAKPV